MLAARIAHRRILQLLSGQSLRQLLLVVIENPLPILLERVLLRIEDDCLKDLSAPLRADEQAEWDVVVTVDVHLPTSEILKKQINGRRAIILHSLLGAAAALDNSQEFLELYLAILINRRHNLLDLLPIIHETQSNQRLL